MKSIENIEVTLYLYAPWARALAEFAQESLAGESLSTELKGALIEVMEGLVEAFQAIEEAVPRAYPVPRKSPR